MSAPANKDESTGTLRDLFDSMWEELFAYQTVKIVRTHDWRLSVMKKLFNSGILVYVLFYIIFFHGYMIKEIPTSTTTVIMDTTLRDFKTAAMLAGQVKYPGYCTNRTDYIWLHALGKRQDFINNECSSNYQIWEESQLVGESIMVFTFWQQGIYERTCGDVSDAEYTGDPLTLAQCNTTLLKQQNVYPLNIEDSQVLILGSYQTTWGDTGSNMKTVFFPRDEGHTSERAITFKKGTPAAIQLRELLALADVDLEDENYLSDGSVTNEGYPKYRMTGAELTLDLEYKNFYEEMPPDPFNFEDSLRIGVFLSSKGTWRQAETTYSYSLESADEIDRLVYARTPHAVYLRFQSGGSIGKFDFGQLVLIFVNAVVLFGVATTLVDISAAFLIEGFKQQKFEDDLEIRIRRMLRDQLSDGPTRVEVELYEHQELMKQKFAAQTALDAIKSNNNKKAEVEDVEVDVVEEARKGATAQVTHLVVEGGDIHSSFLTAQATLVGCKYVRFQWYVSTDGNDFDVVEDETNATFFPNVDDLDCMVRVEASPVADDGSEGHHVVATTNWLRTSRELLKAATTELARGDNLEFRAYDEGNKVLIRITKEKVLIFGAGGKRIRQWRLDTGDTPLLLLMRDNLKAFIITDTVGENDIYLSMLKPADRELLAMCFRARVGDPPVVKSLAGYTPEATKEDLRL